MLPVLLTLSLLAQSPAPELAPRATPYSEPDPVDSMRPLRIPLETVGGAAFALAVGLGATFLVCAAAGPNGGTEDVPPCLLTGAILTPLALPLGTWLVGNALDGNGSLLACYGGLLASGALVAGMALGMGNAFDDSPVPTYLSWALIAIGPTVGYELTTHSDRRLALVPVLGGGRSGLALVGTF